MHYAYKWQQVPTFEPDNPGQLIQEHYTGLPGGWSSYYWNQVPMQDPLMGATSPTTLTRILVAGGVGLVGLGAFLLVRRRRR